jgi:UDP-N-acetylglucosamine 2-epimerase (non-hydrolysing)
MGTRPEAIKLAPVVAAVRKRGSDPRAVVIATAQHRELLDQVLRVFSIEPDVDLSLMRPDQPLPALTARAVESLSRTFARRRPDLVLVQGDTTTSLAGALAAFYHHIPVGHVEAGLRTDDRYHPYPEEINRRLTSALAELHFCPTATALTRLRKEGARRDRLFLTGNTVIDAVRAAVRSPYVPPAALRSLYASRRGPLLLVTAHRRESHGAPLEAICEALRALAARHPDLTIAYPVHPSPNVRVPVRRLLGDCERVRLLPPLDYLAFVHLMRRATVLLTDSGGIQEEGPALGVPVLVMRNVTERPEAIAAGAARLVGTDPRRIARETSRLLTDERALRRMGRVRDVYGDGKAAKRIAALSAAFLSARGLKSARVASFRARVRSDRSGR